MKRRVALSVSLALLLTSSAIGDEKQTLTFHPTIMGEMEDAAATKAGFHTSHFRTTHLGFHKYDASDGEQVEIHNGNFVNADQAKGYFDWNLQNRAAQVARQGDKPDPDGKTVGHRAEFLVKSETKEKIWVVMWTDGEQFHLITAPTLECARALEKLCRN